MNKISIIGINYFSLQLIKIINILKCEISAFVSNKEKNIGKNINNIPVISIDDFEISNYDFIIVTNDYKFSSNIDKIFYINEYINLFYDFEVYRAFYEFDKTKFNLEAFITGLSYAEVGIDTKYIPYNIVNFAISSQDLFYDYNIAKYILEHCPNKTDIKFALISLSYYSFDYDLSKSSLKKRSFLYYPFLKVTHNFKNEFFHKKYSAFEFFINNVLQDKFKSFLFEMLKVFHENNWSNFINNSLNDDKINAGIKTAKKDSLKNYPLSVEENISILKNYISLLKANDIIPIIVVCPTTNYYYNNLSSDIKQRFIYCLESITRSENLKILDYFESKIFNDSDFYDVSHLNKKGAKKFTELLVNEINSSLK